jgi:hypothetical protein
MNCVKIDELAFECFHNMFMGVNAQEGNISLDKEDPSLIAVVASFDNIKGKMTLWNIATQCELEEVRKKARESLCDLYLLPKANKKLKEK